MSHEQRIERLEASNRRLKFGLVPIFAVFVANAVYLAPPLGARAEAQSAADQTLEPAGKIQRELRVARLVIVDDNNGELAVLEAGENGVAAFRLRSEGSTMLLTPQRMDIRSGDCTLRIAGESVELTNGDKSLYLASSGIAGYATTPKFANAMKAIMEQHAAQELTSQEIQRAVEEVRLRHLRPVFTLAHTTDGGGLIGVHNRAGLSVAELQSNRQDSGVVIQRSAAGYPK